MTGKAAGSGIWFTLVRVIVDGTKLPSVAGPPPAPNGSAPKAPLISARTRVETPLKTPVLAEMVSNTWTRSTSHPTWELVPVSVPAPATGKAEMAKSVPPKGGEPDTAIL